MFFRTMEYIGTEWKVCGLFVVIIMSLSAVPLVWQTNGLTNVVLFISGLVVFEGFSDLSSKIMQGEAVENKYLYILFNKDKIGYDFIVLFVFFSAILILFKGPFVLVQYTMADKINNFISSLGNAVILLNIFFLILFSMYKVAFYSAFANLFFYRKEVLVGNKGVKSAFDSYFSTKGQR